MVIDTRSAASIAGRGCQQRGDKLQGKEGKLDTSRRCFLLPQCGLFYSGPRMRQHVRDPTSGLRVAVFPAYLTLSTVTHFRLLRCAWLIITSLTHKGANPADSADGDITISLHHPLLYLLPLRKQVWVPGFIPLSILHCISKKASRSFWDLQLFAY